MGRFTAILPLNKYWNVNWNQILLHLKKLEKTHCILVTRLKTAEVSETLGFETETETWVVLFSRLETSRFKAASVTQCLRQQIKSLNISLTVWDKRQKVSVLVSKMRLDWKILNHGLNKNFDHIFFINVSWKCLTFILEPTFFLKVGFLGLKSRNLRLI